MALRKKLLTGTFCLGLFTSGLLIGQNVNPHRHPNLAAAQRFMEQAKEKLDAAQAANEFDLGGHAQKAKQLLNQAWEETKQAAEASNRR